MSGKITINDTTPLDSKTFGVIGSYIMQDDILFHYFTPREALKFAARLKVKASHEEQDRRVEELIIELGLQYVADTYIGN